MKRLKLTVTAQDWDNAKEAVKVAKAGSEYCHLCLIAQAYNRQYPSSLGQMTYLGDNDRMGIVNGRGDKWYSPKAHELAILFDENKYRGLSPDEAQGLFPTSLEFESVDWAVED